MKIAVALLTCDRYDYTVKTVESLKRHNDISDWPLFYADDASQDARVRPYVESQGFRPLLLNDGERMGCTPISDGLLRAVLREVGSGWLVLYLQNDWKCIRPIPLGTVEAWFADPTHMALRMWHPHRYLRRIKRHRWPIRNYAGERIVEFCTSAWPVQLTRLEWFAATARGAKREHTLHLRANKRWPDTRTGMMLNQVFSHLGVQKTKKGIYRSKRRFGEIGEVVVTMTTIPQRVESCAEAIASILMGDTKPDRFILNVGFDPPSCLTDLPIDIKRVEDIGPATKLLPTLEEYRNRRDVLLVTADDDVAYASGWLKALVNAANDTPDCVVCRGGRRIPGANGGPARYRRWRKTRKATAACVNMLPLGVYGVACRPCHFTDRIFDLETMRRTTPRNDDLWFAATRRADVPVRIVTGKAGRGLKAPGPRLARRNLRGENDRAIARLQQELGWPHGSQ